MDIERLRALEKAVELVAKATPDAWAVGDKEYKGPHCNYVCIGAPWQDVAHVRGSHDAMVDTVAGVRYMRANAEAISAAVNFIREHGPALLATASEQTPVADSELPGMWSASDFTGGDPDERCYSDRDLFASNLRSALGKHYDPEAGIVCSVALLAADKNTSPAQTSEARDAARYRWLRNRAINFGLDDESGTPYCVYGIGCGDANPTDGEELDNMIDHCAEIDAAMRQEAGSRE